MCVGGREERVGIEVLEFHSLILPPSLPLSLSLMDDGERWKGEQKLDREQLFLCVCDARRARNV